MFMRIIFLSFFLCFITSLTFAQSYSLSGTVRTSANEVLPFVSVSLKNTSYSAVASEVGEFLIPKVAAGNYTLVVSHIGFNVFEKDITIKDKSVFEQIVLTSAATDLNEVLVKT